MEVLEKKSSSFSLSQRLSLIDWNFPYYDCKNGIHSIHPYPAKFIPEIPRTLIRELSNDCTVKTLQFEIEQASMYSVEREAKRQSTRYSVHGLHEYKGKFNPQVVRGILNILGINKGQTVLDPFCGSGTSIVECASTGINAIGFDINPLAVFIANAKLIALNTPVTLLQDTAIRLYKIYGNCKSNIAITDERLAYLYKWFPLSTLKDIERIREAINKLEQPINNVFLIIASNLLREYSLQEPSDLRIRRRTSPFPEDSFFEVFKIHVNEFIKNVELVQKFTIPCKKVMAYNVDSKLVSCNYNVLVKPPYDAAITSPPYATALPYIDTQRLSLVWAGLCKPSEILSLDAELIGSREFRGSGKLEWQNKLFSNTEKLPEDVVDYCKELENAVGPSDGFRRIAVPHLLYRYFSNMHKAFKNIHKLLKQNAPFALIVGHNRTTLGGTCFNIDTPALLAKLAINTGWTITEILPLETYTRYGMHKNNAVLSETLLILNRK